MVLAGSEDVVDEIVAVFLFLLRGQVALAVALRGELWLGQLAWGAGCLVCC